jgi:hypothetical protein
MTIGVSSARPSTTRNTAHWAPRRKSALSGTRTTSSACQIEMRA